MLSNFTFQDIIGTAFGVSLFPFVIIFPGYVFGWIFDLFDFRLRLFHTKLALSLLLSVAISPILYYLVSSRLSMNAALILTFLIALAFIVLLIREKKTVTQNKPWLAIFWVSFGWIIFAMFLLVDLQWGNGELYFSVESYDHTTRVSIINAMTRTGVPPVNPSYYPGHPVQLTFLYFFWYILCSVIDVLGASFVDARTALFASIIWCGIALMAMIAFYLRLRNGKDIWQRALIGIASLSISGLDIIPAIAIMYAGGGAIGDLEHWNEIISAWVGSLLWVPHHTASLIAGFVGVMLVHSVRGRSRIKQFVGLVFSGIAFSSVLGLSVWVTIVFFLFWAGWMLLLYLQKEEHFLLFLMLLAGLVALILTGPFLLGLLSGNDSGDAGVFPVAFTVRSFRFVDEFLGNSSMLWKYLIRLFFLPLNYFLELGFFAVAAFIWLKAHKADLSKKPYHVAEALLLGASFLIGTFTRSTLIENNDLGWRAWLPGQFVLLIWGVDVLWGLMKSPDLNFVISQRVKYNLILLIILGVATSLLDVTLLRFAHYFVHGSETGREIYSARKAYTLISETLPEDVIVQYNPSIVVNRPVGLYGMRQSAISDRTAYGISMDRYNAKVLAVSEIFNMENLQNWQTLDALCDKHSINVIVVTKSDPLWKSLGLLEKQRASLYADNYNAVFFCGAKTSSQKNP